MFLLPDIPLSLETLKIIFPVSLTMAVVGLLESMMTATSLMTSPTPKATNTANAGARRNRQGYQTPYSRQSER